MNKILEQIKAVDAERRNGKNVTAFPIIDVDIPDSVIVRCPIYANRNRAAKHCAECRHFKGVSQMAYSDDTELTWSQQYAIRCSFILERKTDDII